MPKLTVNGNEVEFEEGMTVLQACELAGEEIPRFCYHERLSIAGNCRMCLVEIKGGPPKPAASCAMPAGDGMEVRTDSKMVKEAREGVMELLLINHPLDCPICDQGGECDLQDQSMAYGTGLSRYVEDKRAVKDKYMGPLIKTHMTRCIHCTRCIRFVTEIAGVEELGATSRGEHMEVGTYVEKSLTSELSGNIIDLCPVGALTSKPFAFRARNWELKKTESVDVMDAVGSNIRVDTRGNEVMRILPRLHEDINEEWISDKTRFAYDGLKLQRLDRPMVRKNGSLQPCSWEEAYAAIAAKFKAAKPDAIGVLAGDQADLESMAALKLMADALNLPNIDCRQDGTQLDAKDRASYLFNTTIAGIEEADLCLLIGTNPRYEAPLVNARIRKRSLRGDFKVASIGEVGDLTYDVETLGSDVSILHDLLEGTHPFAKALKAAKRPMLVLGQSALARSDGKAILEYAKSIAQEYKLIQDSWNGFNVLHKAAARVGGLEVGFVPQAKGLDTQGILDKAARNELDILYLLEADEIDMSALGKTFVIYQGHHGDAGAHRADVILPGAAYTEKKASYINTEGRLQTTLRAAFPPGAAKEDYIIINELSKYLNANTDVSSQEALTKQLAKLLGYSIQFDQIKPAKWKSISKRPGKLDTTSLCWAKENFYLTNAICRASKTMARCASEFVSHQEEAA